MNEIKDYYLVEYESVKDVIKEVKLLLAYGWTVLGSMSFAPEDEYSSQCWYQTMKHDGKRLFRSNGTVLPIAIEEILGENNHE